MKCAQINQGMKRNPETITDNKIPVWMREKVEVIKKRLKHHRITRQERQEEEDE